MAWVVPAKRADGARELGPRDGVGVVVSRGPGSCLARPGQQTANDPREEIATRLTEAGYIADRDLSTALWLMEFLKRPLLLEGEAGVGKTEVAKALAHVHEAELIRLQCYEGLDQNAALYEWNYQRQLLAIKAREGWRTPTRSRSTLFSERYLLERPLLAAIRRLDPPVLLIDEVDRADEEFEAFLLELLSDFQVVDSRARHDDRDRRYRASC